MLDMINFTYLFIMQNLVQHLKGDLGVCSQNLDAN
jgi:hypothetical protein